MKSKINKITLLLAICINISHTTIEDSIIMAHRNSDEVAIKQMNVSLKKADFALSLQKYLPNVSYSVQRGKGNVQSDASFFGGAGPIDYNIKNDVFEVSTAKGGIHRLIANNFFTWYNLKSEQAKYASFLNEMTLMIVNKHLDIIIAKESVALMSMIDDVAKINIDSADLKKLNESMSMNTHLDFESRYDDSSARLIQSKMTLESLIRDYEILTSSKPTNLLMKREFTLPAKNFNDYFKLVESSNKDIEAQYANLKATGAGALLSYADLVLPEVQSIYRDSTMVIGYLPGAPTIKHKEAFVTINFRIYDGGDKITNAVKANIQKRMLNRQIKLLKHQISQKANQYWSDHHSLLLLERAKRKEMEIKEDMMMKIEARHKNRTVSNLELLRAKVNFYNAKVGYLNTYKAFVMNYYKLLTLL